MKILNIISRVIQGPVFYPFFYADMLTIVGIVGILSPYVTNKLSGLIVLILLHQIINAYQFSTQKIASTNVLKEPSQETLMTVKKIAKEERVLRCTVKIITNSPVPAIGILQRFPLYGEAYLSEHFETAEYHNTLIFLLRTEFKRISEGFWGILIWHSISFSSQLASINGATIFIHQHIGHGYWFWIAFSVAVQTATMLRRWHLTAIAKNSIFRWDAKTAEQMGIENAIQALEQLEEISNGDQDTAEFAEWEMAYPKISTRIAKLKGMQKS